VLERLPHGPGFRFIDEAVEVEPGVRGRFAFTLAADHPILQAHFPGRPLVPGVILIEAMAQAAGLVRGGGDDETLGLAAVDRAKIRRPVGPDETVCIDVEVTRSLGRLTLCEATATVDGAVAATATVTLAQLPD
jgi:3-hydroxyacyl-[acyl-carrier-protein] dehydratase